VFKLVESLTTQHFCFLECSNPSKILYSL